MPRLCLTRLEDRCTPATWGNPWPDAAHLTLSFAPDGTHLGTFATGQATGNCAWGNDGSVLYIMADMYIGRVKLNTKGAGL